VKSHCAFSQWQAMNSGTTHNIVDICFPTDSIGYAITTNGEVLKTTDQGNNWNILVTLSGNYTSICALGSDTIFVGGNNIYRSDDAGSSWNNLIALPYTIPDLQFFTSQEGVYINPYTYTCSTSTGSSTINDYQVFQTTDYGSTWQYKFGSLDPLSRFQLINDSIAYITGDYHPIVAHCAGPPVNFGKKTSDKGYNWANAPAPGEYYTSFYFVNDTLGYFFGGSISANGALWRMSGTNLNMVRPNINAINFVFVNKIDGYLISSQKNILSTKTEGIVWDLEYSGADTLNKLINCHNKQMFAIGTNGTILKTTIVESLFPDSVYRMSVDTNYFDFDSVMVSGNKTKQVRITNDGNMPLTVNINSSNIFQISFSNTGYSSNISFTLPPVQDTLLNIRFLPIDTLHYYDTLTINATNISSIHIPLNGVGINDLKGFISGIVTICKDTVNVVGDLTINIDGKLIVCPGTTVLFQGQYKLDVKGTLIAEGLQNDSIRFKPANILTGWKGISFSPPASLDTSIMKFCLVEHAIDMGWPNGEGGGLSFEMHSNVIVDSCKISNNYAEFKGGGIYISSSSPFIINSKIVNNKAAAGGGIYITYSSTAMIMNNEIYNNRTTQNDGAGIHVDYTGIPPAYPNIIQNLIFNNASAQFGGGIILKNDACANIINNTICNNSANLGIGGLGLTCGWNGSNNVPSLVYNNIIYNNSPNQISGQLGCDSVFYTNVKGGYAAGIGIIDQLPGFVNPTPFFGYMNPIGNYDWSLIQTSPCINTGDSAYNSLIPSLDFVGNPRINQGRIDMGAFEHQQTISLNEIESKNSFVVFPNPFNEGINVDGNNMDEELEFILYDSLLREMIRKKFTSPFFLNTEHLANGLYFYEVQSKKGSCTKGKIIKN
jgi:photosystem II stability/assembly factor-like uncharacterized protein